MRNRLVIAFGLAGLAGGCAAQNASAAAGRDQRPQIALRRGGDWSTLTVDPPHITGPSVELELSKGTLRGFLGGGAMDVKIQNDRASGFGPSGPVEMEVEPGDGEIKVDGMWNGGPVHFTLGQGTLHGTLIWRGAPKMSRELSCGYDLGPTNVPGTLVGTSSCGGAIVGTRLEVDPRVSRMMSPAEVTVVLVAALSSPP